MKYLVIRSLYRIKAHHPKTWAVIEYINSLLFGIFYARTFRVRLAQALNQECHKHFQFRFLSINDREPLLQLLHSIEPHLSGFFEPHHFTPEAITHLKNKAFFMLGAYSNEKLIGYFFIRAGINKKCFVGRLVHKDFRSKGIGRKMNHIMYHAAWESGFRVFATLSHNNHLVMQSHKNNPHIHILKALPDNYQIVEFIKQQKPY